MRNSLTAGQSVGVVLRWGNQERVVTAIVIEVVRAAARVKFIEGHERLISFSNLRMIEQARANGHAATERPPAPRPVPALPVPRPVPAPTPAPAQQLTELDAWVAMGRELLEPIETECAQLRAEGEAIDLEMAALEDRRGAIVERLRALHGKRESIARLVKLVDSEAK